MARKNQAMQRLILHYKDVTGRTEVNMNEVAKFAVEKMGWKLPPPDDPLKRLAKRLSLAAREEIRYDKETGRPYRANHVISTSQGEEQLRFWIDIDEAPRKKIFKSLQMRREQMVSDGVLLTLDQDHWNSIHPDEEPIQLVMDFTLDIEWRKNALYERKKAS